MHLVDRLFLSLGCGLLCITAIAAASTEAWGMTGLWIPIGIVSAMATVALFVATVVKRFTP